MKFSWFNEASPRETVSVVGSINHPLEWQPFARLVTKYRLGKGPFIEQFPSFTSLGQRYTSPHHHVRPKAPKRPQPPPTTTTKLHTIKRRKIRQQYFGRAQLRCHRRNWTKLLFINRPEPHLHINVNARKRCRLPVLQRARHNSISLIDSTVCHGQPTKSMWMKLMCSRIIKYEMGCHTICNAVFKKR